MIEKQTNRIVCCQYCGCHAATRRAVLDRENWFCTHACASAFRSRQQSGSVAVGAFVAIAVLLILAWLMQ